MDKKKRKIYISLPISDYDLEERKELAMQTEVKLRSRGYDVFNPLGDKWEGGLTTHDYMKRDLKELLECDSILILHGWNRSCGCKLELDIAVAIGLDVFFEDMGRPQEITMITNETHGQTRTRKFTNY